MATNIADDNALAPSRNAAEVGAQSPHLLTGSDQFDLQRVKGGRRLY